MRKADQEYPLNIESGTTMTESQILSGIYKEVQRRFATFDDPAHGWEHVKRVYELALYIAEREGADRFIAAAAALLHDIGRAEPFDDSEIVHHAEQSAVIAARLLKDQQVAPDKQEAILHAIRAHSFSRGVEPSTLEAGVVRDADRLDGLGAIGIMRWAVTGAVRRTAHTRNYHPDDPFAEQHAPDDKIYMLDHFFVKLLKLESTMMTQTGRTLALRRTAFMHTYLDEFKKELALSG